MGEIYEDKRLGDMSEFVCWLPLWEQSENHNLNDNQVFFVFFTQINGGHLRAHKSDLLEGQ